MGFVNDGNRKSASKGRELELIGSMEYTGRVYRVYDPILGSWLVPSGSNRIEEVRDRGDPVEEIQSIEKLDAELKYFEYDDEIGFVRDEMSAEKFGSSRRFFPDNRDPEDRRQFASSQGDSPDNRNGGDQK